MKRDCPCECSSKSESLKHARCHPQANIVRLNVGGKCFDTTAETLLKLPIFQPVLEGRFDFARDEDGRFFVDRDGMRFQHVLQFARDARRPSRAIIEKQREELLSECDFFMCDALKDYLRDDISQSDMRWEDRQIAEDELHVRQNPGEDHNLLMDFFQKDCSPLPRESLHPHALLTKAPRAVVACNNLEEFIERLNTFSGGGLVDALSKIPDICIAGGSVIGSLVNAPSSDIDVFFTCGPGEADKRFQSVFEAIKSQLLKKRGSSHARMLVARTVQRFIDIGHGFSAHS